MALHRLYLRHHAGQTPIVIGPGALDDLVGELDAWLCDRTVFIITTPRVWRLHAELLTHYLDTAAAWHRLEVAEGEASKALATAERLWEEMISRGGKRDSRVIAFGGGSVGDVGGFVAGCFLRGVSFAQVPTTLLAQVDAAIGGKTGINLPGAKNSVGLFRQPWAVAADTRVLATLPERELRAGLVEVVKAGVVLDRSLFELVERGRSTLFNADPQALAAVIAAAVQAKIEIVEQDPQERDLRRLLNFGHTLGHALEARLEYRGLLHGEAVAYGMLFALRLATLRGLPLETADRIRRLLQEFELPTLPKLAIEDLQLSMRRDKKALESGLAWVLPQDLGTGEVVNNVDEAEVRSELGSFLADPWSRG